MSSNASSSAWVHASTAGLSDFVPMGYLVSSVPLFGPLDALDTARGIESTNLYTYTTGRTELYQSSSIKEAYFPAYQECRSCHCMIDAPDRKWCTAYPGNYQAWVCLRCVRNPPETFITLKVDNWLPVPEADQKKKKKGEQA